VSYIQMTAAETEALDAFVARLRDERVKRHMPLSEVANRIGANLATVHNWERGRRRPSDQLLRALAAALQVDVPEGVHGWLPSTSPCGTMAGCQAHRRRGETPCTPCQEAHNAYQRDWRTGRRRAS
jgi:transcriptional regulator with XRE-family HTH domain